MKLFKKKTADKFELEIKAFLRLMLSNYYSPSDVKINMDNKTALIVMYSQNELEEFMNRYKIYSQYNFSIFICNYYKNRNERNDSDYSDPFKMFSHFKNLTVHDPNKKPIIYKNLNNNDKLTTNINSSDLKDELASIIYENVEKKDSTYIFFTKGMQVK